MVDVRFLPTRAKSKPVTACLATLGHQNGVRGQVAVNDLDDGAHGPGPTARRASPGAFGRKVSAIDALLRCRRSAWPGKSSVTSTTLSSSSVDEEILHRQHVGVGRHVRHGAIGVADLLELFLAGRLVLVRDRPDTPADVPCRRSCPTGYALPGIRCSGRCRPISLRPASRGILKPRSCGLALPVSALAIWEWKRVMFV